MKKICIFTLLFLPALAVTAGNVGTVYFDNSAAAWGSPHIHYWDNAGGFSTDWPGVPMSQGPDGLWYYTIEDIGSFSSPMVIFTDGVKGEGTRQTGNLEFVSGAVYNTSGLIDTSSVKKWTVVFRGEEYLWPAVYTHIWTGSGSATVDYNGFPGAPMAGSAGGDWTLTFYTNSLGRNANIMFGDGNGGGNPADQTGTFALANGGVYGYDGLLGYVDDMDEGIESGEDAGAAYFDNLGFERTVKAVQSRPDGTGEYSDEEVDVPDAWDVHYAENSAKLVKNMNTDAVSGALSHDDRYEVVAAVTADGYNVSGERFFLANCCYGDYAGMTVLSQRSKTVLPKGVYRLSATIDAGMGLEDKIVLFASLDDAEEPLATAFIDYGGNDTSSAGRTSLSFTLDEDAYVTIGIKTTPAFGATPAGAASPAQRGSYLWLYADDFSLEDEVLSISVTDAGHATFFTNHSYVMPAGLEGTTVSGWERGGTGTDGVLLTPWEYKEGDTVPGHAALLVRAADQSAGETDFSCRIVKKDDEGGKNLDNRLMGSVTQTLTTAPEGMEKEDVWFYKLSLGDDGTEFEGRLGFYWAGYGYDDFADGQGGPFLSDAHKCWLVISREEAAENGAKPAGFPLEPGGENTTGIHTAAPETAKEGAVYDIRGVRVADTARKGVYIVNGRKMIVK